MTDRQREIVDTAVDIIAEEGIQRFTTKELARRIGISEPALYRHFESKLSILVAILDHFADWSRATIEEIASSDRTPDAKLRELFRRQTIRFMESPTSSGVLFAEEIFKDSPELIEAVKTIMGRAMGNVRRILTEGVDDGTFRGDVPIDYLAMTVLGALRLLVTRWRMSRYDFNLYEEGMRLADSVILMCRRPDGTVTTDA